MYIYVCVCVCVSIYIYVCVCVSIYICVCVCVCVWLIVKLRFLFWGVLTRLLMDQVLTISLVLGKICPRSFCVL